MIVKFLLELIFGLLQIVFAPINLPDLPDGIHVVIERFVEIISSAVGLFSVFVDFTVVKWLLPVVVAIVFFDRIWKLIMFILRKIPFIGVQ